MNNGKHKKGTRKIRNFHFSSIIFQELFAGSLIVAR